MKTFILLLFLLVVSESVLSVTPVNNTHVNCYISHNMPMQPRPSSQRTAALTPEERRYMSLSRHHIIPYATMVRFYNALRTAPDRRYYQHLFENVLQHAAQNVGLELVTSDNLELLRRTPLGDLTSVLQTYVTRSLSTTAQVRTALEAYAWLPFNIYIGPEPIARSDDERSDTLDQVAHGIIGQPRQALLRHMHGEIIQYLNSPTRIDPTAIINSMRDMVRTNPLPYSFNTDQWRVHRTTNRYAIATPAIVSDYNYVPVPLDVFCSEDAMDIFNLYYPPEHELRRSRRDVQNGCIFKDEGAKYDPFCIKSLDLLRELVKNKTLSISGTELETVNTAVGKTNRKVNCNTPAAAVTGAAVGGGTVLGLCLLFGGAYIPFFGWAGCGIASAMYSIGGAALGTSVNLAACDIMRNRL